MDLGKPFGRLYEVRPCKSLCLLESADPCMSHDQQLALEFQKEREQRLIYRYLIRLRFQQLGLVEAQNQRFLPPGLQIHMI